MDMLIVLIPSTLVLVVLAFVVYRMNSRVQELTAEVSVLGVNLKDREDLLADRDASEERLRARVQELTVEVSALGANLKDRDGQLNLVSDERDGLRRDANELTGKVAALEVGLKAKEEQIDELDVLEKRSLNAFKVLSSDIVKDQGELLRSRTLESIDNLIKPLSEKIEVLDRARAQAEGSLSGEITKLTSETEKLASALSKSPQVRGRWGEMAVERVLELSGLAKGTHYSGLAKGTHYTVQDSDGEGGRTDFIVRLSNDRHIIIDSKVSLVAYFDAEGATDEEECSQFLVKHARAVRNQVDDLAKKEYQQNLPDTADFVVMAIPDFALPPAAQHDNSLIDYALGKGIVIVTFSMLVPLLKCVAMGWQQKRIGEEGREIAECVRELYRRLRPFAASHLRGVGYSLGKAVEAYNKSVGSFDLSVMPQAQRAAELVGSTDELPGLEEIDPSIRVLKDRS